MFINLFTKEVSESRRLYSLYYIISSAITTVFPAIFKALRRVEKAKMMVRGLALVVGKFQFCMFPRSVNRPKPIQCLLPCNRPCMS